MTAPRVLSSGAIKRAFEGNALPNEQPILQVLDIKPIKDTGRFRVVLSDGVHWQQGMFASQLNETIRTGGLTAFSVLRVTSSTVTPVADKKLIIVLACDVLDQSPSTIIGNPIAVAPSPSSSTGGGAAAAAASPANNTPAARSSSSSSGGSPAKQAASTAPRTSPAKTAPSGRPAAAAPVARPAAASSSSGFVRSETKAVANTTYHPINSLNAYINRWVIKARVTNKSDQRSYQNQRGEGRIFNFDLLDQSGEIQVTCFNEACDKWMPLIEVDKVYQISKGQIKTANRRFCKLNHEYSITLNADAEVIPMDDDRTIDQQHYDFKKINMLADCKAEDNVDVIAVCTKVGEATTITAKRSGKELTKRTLVLADDSNCSIELTVWGAQVAQCATALDRIIAIKAAKISEFSGHSITASFGSAIAFDPERDEAYRLRAWYDSDGKNMNLQPLSEGRSHTASMIDGREIHRTIADIENQQLGVQGVDTFVTKATLTFITSNMAKPPWYKACPKEGCSRKVSNEGDGNDIWLCTKCGPQDHYIPRYILQITLADETAAWQATMFNDHAEPLMGVSARELEKFVDAGDDVSFKQAFSRPLFHTYLWKLRAKSDNVKDELRTKCQVMGLKQLNYKQQCNALLTEINSHRQYY